jgi:hypothetical protein
VKAKQKVAWKVWNLVVMVVPKVQQSVVKKDKQQVEM